LGIFSKLVIELKIKSFEQLNFEISVRNFNEII